MDRIDREILAALSTDGRATYQELGRRVRLSANTLAERVRRLRAQGVIAGYAARLDLGRLGRPMTLLTDVQLREGVERADFERGLAEVAQIVAAVHVTGEYDYELRLACTGTAEVESVVDTLKATHGVLRVRSRLVLSEVVLDPGRLIHLPPFV